MATVIIEDFNALSNGVLNGQNGWSGDTGWTVQTGTVYEGAKAAQFVAAGGNHTIYKLTGINVPATATAIFFTAVRMSNTNGALSWAFLTATGGISQVMYQGQFQQLVNGQTNTGLTWSINTWYLIGIEVDFANNQVRYNSNGGAFSSWYNPTISITGQAVTSMYLNKEATTANAYVDNIYYTQTLPMNLGNFFMFFA